MTVHEGSDDRFSPLLSRIVWTAVLLVVAATPLIVDPRGRDVFRVPKTAFFQAGMLVAGALAAAAALLSDAFAEKLARHRRAVMLACAAVAWVAIGSMLSTLPAVSRNAPFAILCHALLFVITMGLARTTGPLPALGALLLPAAVNAAVVVMQTLDLWQPLGISFEEGADRYGNIGLIGNPNTAGTYLLIPTIAAFAATVALRRYRLPLAAVTVLLLAGLFATQTITVMFGFTAALAAFVVAGSKRIRLLAAALVVLGLVGVLLFPPTRERLASLRKPLMRGDFSALTSNRLPAAYTTLGMFLDRPLLGIGPGAFPARYMPRRLAIEDRHPEWFALARENFGEAHNDHLQVLAETGIPGYALLAAVLAAIASFTLRRRSVPADERGRFVGLFALPAAAAFAAVALGQFPLHLTAASATCTFAAALCFAWRPDAAD